VRRLAPLSRALIAANVVVYLLQVATGDGLLLRLALWPPGAEAEGLPGFAIWQVVTYAFLHGNGSHLFVNMLALYMFGSDIERLLGPRRYLTYYFACVVGAALVQLAVVTFVAPSPFPTVGASGAIFGLLLAFGMAYPKRMVLLIFPPIPMPAWLFVTLYGTLELVLGVTGTQQGVAHFAHLGGMAAGWLLLRRWRARSRRVQVPTLPW
jgi:membrane associated rhomboid family serine protease